MTKRRIVRFSALVLILLLVQAPLLPTWSGDSGRDFSRCVIKCNNIRKACRDACPGKCEELFPDDNDKKARRACIKACQATCSEEWMTCHDVCLAEKMDQSPTRP